MTEVARIGYTVHVRRIINAVLGLESSFGCCSDICVWLLRIWKHSSLHSYHFTLQISKKSECIRMFAIITFYQLFTHFQLYNLFSLFDDFHPKKSWLMTTSLVCCYSFIWTINVWTVHCDHSDQGWRGAAFVEFMNRPGVSPARLRTWPASISTTINPFSKYTDIV